MQGGLCTDPLSCFRQEPLRLPFPFIFAILVKPKTIQRIHNIMIFLVDGDNNIGTGLKGIDMLSPQDTVLVFYQKTGLALSKIQKLCAGTQAGVQYVESVRGGRNAIDFQIITELGVLVGRGETDYAYVISQDKGYAASIDALRARYADAFREVDLRPSIEDCLPLPFLLRSADRKELERALIQEYGACRGSLLYGHLKSLFDAPEPSAAPEKPARPSRSRRGSRKKKPALEQPAE
jgi:hypothetical protein